MFTIEQLITGYREKKFSPVEIIKDYLTRTKRKRHLNAFISLTEDIALQQAKVAETNWQLGKPRRLEGIPLSYKDNLLTKGIPTTSGSKIDAHFIPEIDAKLVHTLNEAGAVMIGKNNMHEFAFGITNNNPFYGPAKNPWNKELIPGGSSGGSAVAVATDLSVASIGTDTGGSVRIPAACCGLVGLKPTYNLLPNDGITLISWTLDHPGPITRNVSDLITLMETLTNKRFPVMDTNATSLCGVKLGIPTTFFMEKIEADVLATYEKILAQLETLGAKLIEVEVPHVEEANALAFTIATAEGGYTHKERIKTHMEEYGYDVQHVMKASQTILAKDYIHALHRKTAITAACVNLFEQIDALITPTTPAQAKPIGQKIVEIDGVKEPIFDCMIRYTSYFNFTGHPAISLPADLVNDIPIGIQLISGKWQDDKLIKIAKRIEEQLLGDFYKQRKKMIDII